MRNGFTCIFLLSLSGMIYGMCDTRLGFALVIRDIQEFNNLLCAGAPVNVYDAQGNRPLHYATKICCIEAVHALLAKKADPNVSNNEWDQPLHYAVQKRCLQIVQELLSRGANPLAKNRQGKTPLDIAQAYEDKVTGPLLGDDDDEGTCVFEGQLIQEILTNAVAQWARRIADQKAQRFMGQQNTQFSPVHAQ